MKELNLPGYSCKIIKKDEKLYIFDPIRKKYLVLTPEEWVRQHFINYLLEYLNYPKGLIITESGVKYNSLSKRADIIIYNKKAQPSMVVECKAPEIKIDQKVFEQVAQYNKIIGAKYIVVTNGMQHYCCIWSKEEKMWKFLPDIPTYS